MIHQLQDTQDNGRHLNWLHIIIGGLALPCRSRTMYQDVINANEWNLFWKSQQKSLSPMKQPYSLGRILLQILSWVSQKQGYDALFITCCRYTKQAHIIPTSTTTSARGLATLFRDHIWKLHGLPVTALSDRGPQFAAEFMKELNEILGIKTKLLMVYHPQTDGQMEQVNQKIEQYLRMFISHRQNNWPEWIICAKFAYNNKIHTATHISPFYSNYGMNPRMGIEPWRGGKSELAKEFAEWMKIVYEEAQVALSKSHNDIMGNQKLTVQTLVISLMNSTNPTPLLPESSMHKLLQNSYSALIII